MINFDSTGFHGATVLRVTASRELLVIELEDVARSPSRSVVLNFTCLANLSVDDVPVEVFQMERSDGEVLSFIRQGSQFTLIVEWHEFTSRSSHMAAWRWEGEVEVIAGD